MKVLLTGATGFIGSHLARLLVESGVEVSALVREGSDLWRVKDIAARLRLVHADLRDMERVKARLAEVRPDICLHLAWYSVPGLYLKAMDNLASLSNTLNLATELARLGCPRFVGVGTCFEYDFSTECLSEASATRPRSLYAASKLSAQMVLEQLAALTGMEVAWARLFYLYGPYEPEPRLVPHIINSLLRGKAAPATPGEQVRDFLHVADVAAALWAVAQSHLTGPVNIGSGRPVTVREVITRIAAIIGRPELVKPGALPYAPDDPMFVCADNRKLIEQTGWLPRYDLEQGLRQTVGWWREHLSSRKEITS